MSRDIGDNRWTGTDVTVSLGTPAIGRGLVVGCASSEARAMEDAPDRRRRGHAEPFALEMPGDRQRAGVEPLRAELAA